MLKRLKLSVVVTALLLTLGWNHRLFADEEIAAQALADAIIAGVVSITINVTQNTIDEYSAAVTELIESNNVRLISIRPEALGNNNKPRGKTEKDLLDMALASEMTEMDYDGNTFTMVIPLDNNDACAICHTDFLAQPPGTFIGALSVSRPVD